MAFNGSGLFVRLYNWVFDRDNSIKIQAQRMDDEMDGFATGLSNCVTADGQTTTTAIIPFALGISTPSITVTSQRLAKTANYTVVNANKSKVLALGGTTCFTLTFTAASGYDADFRVTVLNEDTGRAKIVDLNGTTFFLFPLQSVTVYASNSVWYADRPGRWKITAPVTVYVRTDGDDDNDGLANTSAGAFLTLQQAWTWALAYIDISGFYLTIQVADGTYTSASYVLDAGSMLVGQQNDSHVQIVGNITTPANCILAGDLAGVVINQNARVWLQGFRFKSSAGVGISVTQDAWCAYSYVDFNDCAVAHYSANKAGQIYDNGNISITHSAPVHGIISDAAVGYETIGTTTLVGTPGFAGGYIVCNQGGKFTHHTKTYSGAATGPRFNAINGGIISAATQTVLPGNAAGTLDDTSIFIPGDSSDTSGLYPGWQTFTPVVTPGSTGAITTGTCTCRYKTEQRSRTVVMTLPISANTATGWFAVTIPGSPKADGAATGVWALGGSGAGALGVSITAGFATITLVKYDGTVPTGTGTIQLTFEFELS